MSEEKDLTQQNDTAATEAPEHTESNENLWKVKYLRAAADLENYRRRMDKERANWAHAAQAEVLADVVAIVDDFDRALSEQGDNAELANWMQGMEIIRKQLQKMLDTHHVTEVEVAAFDPERHEALTQVDSPDHESGAIVEVFQKGYLFNGQVLRPAKVSVAK